MSRQKSHKQKLQINQTREAFLHSETMANIAASDSAHDFGTLFTNKFKTFKQIGTNTIPTKTIDEYGVLDTLIHFQKDSSPLSEQYKQKFLIGVNSGTIEKIFSNSEPIQWKSKKIFSKKKNQDRNETWNLTAPEMYDWLNVDGSNSIACVIDATNIPFYDIFLLDSKQGTTDNKQRIIYNILSRETMNDPASKTRLAQYSTRNIPIVDIDDSQGQTVLYPVLDSSKPLDFNKCFVSTSNISLSRVTNTHPKTMTVQYSNPNVKSILVNLSSSVDRSNSIATIKSNTKNLFKPSTTLTQQEEFEYYTALQQKRGGDWLQILSAMDTKRYIGIPSNTNIFIVTHDRICLAYALIMGVNVVFTQLNFTNTDTTGFLTFFYTNQGKKDPTDMLQEYLQSQTSQLNQYTQFKKSFETYTHSRNKQILSLQFQIQTICDSVSTNDIPQLQTNFKKLITCAIELSFLLESVPALEPIDDRVMTIATDLELDLVRIKAGDKRKREDLDTNTIDTNTIDTIYKTVKTFLNNIVLLKHLKTISTTIPKNFSPETTSVIQYMLQFPHTYDRGSRMSSRKLFTPTESQSQKKQKNVGFGFFSLIHSTLQTQSPQSISAIINWFNSVPVFSQEHQQTYWSMFKDTAIQCLNPTVTIQSRVVNSSLLRAIDNFEYDIDMEGGVKTRSMTRKKKSKLVKFNQLNSNPKKYLSRLRGTQKILKTSKSQQWEITLDISDVIPAILILSKKAFIKLNQKQNRISIESDSQSNHSPYTTLYFVLREIYFRLSEKEKDLDDYDKLLQLFIKIRDGISNSIGRDNVIQNLEYEILTTNPLHLNILQTYYGFILPHEYVTRFQSKSLLITRSTDTDITIYTIQSILVQIQDLMKHLIQTVSESESGFEIEIDDVQAQGNALKNLPPLPSSLPNTIFNSKSNSNLESNGTNGSLS